MARVRVRVKHIGYKETKSKYNFIEKITRKETRDLGEKTKDKMQSIISSNKKRPQAGEPTELENAIDVEHFEDLNKIGWGVGNMDILKKEAPGWRAVNFGSGHMVGKQLPAGVFDPGMAKPDAGSFREGRFKKGLNKGGSTYAPFITKPIPAMNYIQKTITFVNRQFNKLASNFKRV